MPLTQLLVLLASWLQEVFMPSDYYLYENAFLVPKHFQISSLPRLTIIFLVTKEKNGRILPQVVLIEE